ncbi:hypothetical protein HY641_00115 [Candidatus Woesearchaeota archaeon]|nr:hypothetical protein [Candidatus Woesearchaeota archaeon]
MHGLERMLGELYAENVLLKKVIERSKERSLEERRAMIQTSTLPITRSCQALDVKRSTYYNWIGQTQTPDHNQELLAIGFVYLATILD